MGLKDLDWATTALLLGASSLVYVVVGGIRRVYFSPLSKFPGPKWAALTLWNEFYYDVVKRGTFIWKIQEMHEQYGPIVRINPYEIHIIDPDFFDDFYSGQKRLDKYRWWTNLAGADGSGFSTVPHDLHRMRRAALSPFFSARAVTQLEPMLKSKVEKLSARFDAIADSHEVVRLDAALMALTMDIICDYSFARDRRYLDKPDFEVHWKHTLISAFESGALSRQLPWLASFMKRLPISVVTAMNPSIGYLLEWQNGVKEQVKPILDQTGEEKADEASTRTIFHYLRDSNLPPEEKELQRLCDEGEILTGAGSETTAQASTRILFYLKQVPETLAKLRDEIDRAIPDPSNILSWVELQQLPYLTAVIKEGVRLSYGVTTRLPRICHEDVRYKDYIIPAGTPISGTPYFVLMHPDVFPEPETFRPDRWLETESGKRLDKYLVAFGKGTRQCLGINLAWAEMYLTLSTLVRRFDWEMYETTLDDIVCKRDFFVAHAALDSKGVRATLTRRSVEAS